MPERVVLECDVPVRGERSSCREVVSNPSRDEAKRAHEGP